MTVLAYAIGILILGAIAATLAYRRAARHIETDFDIPITGIGATDAERMKRK